MLRQTGAYAAPALVAISLLGGIWTTESYLKELMYWYFNVRPLTKEAERALKPMDPFRECRDCPEMIRSGGRIHDGLANR